MRNKFLLACLILSGFAGLSYELLWVRLLSFSFGSTSLSFSTVLAVFFGGLAIGSWLSGRRAARLERPARVYAWIEIGTGVLGLALYPVLTHLDGVFALIDPGEGLAGALVRLLVAAPILIGPTLLMGATLPVVTRAMVTDDAEIGGGTALIYGFNTFGAFLGAYLVTYHLLPELGIWGSTLITVAANFVVGAIALLAPMDPLPPAATAEEAKAPLDDAERRAMVSAAVLTFVGGFAAIVLQTVWVRLYSIFLAGTVYGVGSVLICVLIGIALGSLLISEPLRHARHLGLWFGALQLLTVLSTIALAELLPWLDYELRAIEEHSRGLPRLHLQLVLVMASLAVPTICSGASFPLLIRAVERRAARTGRSLGSLYAANTVGAILGSIAGGFVLLPMSGSVATTFLAITLTALVGALGALALGEATPRPLRLVAALLALSSLGLYDGFDAQALALVDPGRGSYGQHRAAALKSKSKIALFAEASSSSVVVIDDDDFRALSLNGLGQGMRNKQPPHHAIESLLVAMVPMVHRPSVEDALVVGLGAGVTVDAMLELGAGHIRVIELERDVVDAVGLIFAERNPLTSKRVEVEIGDARHRMLLSSAGGTPRRHDLITVMPSHPWVASSIFTREFFELARRNLSDDGIFTTWFGVGKMMDRAAVQALMRAFVGVFPSYVLYWVPESQSYFLVGSPSALQLDVDRLAALHQHPIVAAHAALADPLFLPQRIYASGTPDTPPPPAGVVNTDDSAFIELHAPRSTTASPAFEDFMPAEALLPALVRGADVPAFYDDLIESLLGSPEGLIPDRSRPARPRQAERSLRAAAGALGPARVAYFEARLQTLDPARRAEGAVALERIAAGPDADLAARARRFRALLAPTDAARVAALAALPPDPDVLARLADDDLDLALSRVPGEAPDPDAAPLAWLWWAAARLGGPDGPPPAQPGPEARRALGGALRGTERIGLLEVCRRAALALDWVAESDLCAAWKRTAERAEAGRLRRQAGQLGARGDFEGASRSLDRMLERHADDPRGWELRLEAAVRAQDAPAAMRAEKVLTFLGHGPERIRAIVARAAPRPAPR